MVDIKVSQQFGQYAKEFAECVMCFVLPFSDRLHNKNDGVFMSIKIMVKVPYECC